MLVGDEKAVELIAKAGFDACEISMFDAADNDGEMHRLMINSHPLSGGNYLAYARRLKQIGLDNGIVCNQSHAPFPSWGLESVPVLKRSIECTAEAGGEISIIHPKNNITPEEKAKL